MGSTISPSTTASTDSSLGTSTSTNSSLGMSLGNHTASSASSSYSLEAHAISQAHIVSNTHVSQAPAVSNSYAISNEEALLYYAGLHSRPKLIYRTGGHVWIAPTGPEAYPRKQELRPVFNHPIMEVWNDNLGWRVVKTLDGHQIHFTTIDVVRFKMVEVPQNADEETISPVTIWIGVFPESTTPTAAHDAAQDVLALLKDYHITDVDVHFRESSYTLHASLVNPVNELNPDPLVNVVAPLTSALGLCICPKASPGEQGTMALYLAQGGGSDELLGLSCRHVLMESSELNEDYLYSPSDPRKDVLLLGEAAFKSLVLSIDFELGDKGIELNKCSRRVERLREREKEKEHDADTFAAEKAKAVRITAEEEQKHLKHVMDSLLVFLGQVNTDWKELEQRILGHVLYSPAITLGAGEHRFTEDWGIFRFDRAKLSDGFHGNKIDLGRKLTPGQFTRKCFPTTDAEDHWAFTYPDDGLLTLDGIISHELMSKPDMWDAKREPCLLVVKNGKTTNTTIGRANGPLSITRKYPSSEKTSMEWCILNYDSKSEAFSEKGDSGSIIADIRGNIGGMLTGGTGNGLTTSSDVTYATPFWWLLERIKASGFPDVHLDVVT